MIRELIWAFVESIFYASAVIGMVTLMILASTSNFNILEFLKQFFN